MVEFISEPITPLAGTADSAAMARGLPGLPAGFEWRGVRYRVAHTIDAWKWSSRAGSSAQGQAYLRRHYFRLRLSDGSTWTVYCLRQAPRSGPGARRWYLLERVPPAHETQRQDPAPPQADAPP